MMLFTKLMYGKYTKLVSPKLFLTSIVHKYHIGGLSYRTNFSFCFAQLLHELFYYIFIRNLKNLKLPLPPLIRCTIGTNQTFSEKVTICLENDPRNRSINQTVFSRGKPFCN